MNASPTFVAVADSVTATVTRLLFTTQKRCAYYPNPKRPTWRCKAAPTWLVRIDGSRGAAVCDEHLDVMRNRTS